MNDFVLEIGAENVPASYLPPAIAQLEADARATLERCRLVYKEIYTTGTPRRLVLVVRELADRQAEGEEVITGPPVSRAFGADGRPTPAAEGFARAQGLEVSALERVATAKGEYLAVRRRLERRKTVVVLREELPALVTGLKFPKTMKWEESGTRFARPLRWLLALYGRDVVPFRVAGVDSGRTTFARPWMRGERRTVTDARAYPAQVRSLGILLDHTARRERIRALALKAAAAQRCAMVEDDDLITELSFMVEDPRLLMGSFEARYLDLPPEVIVIAMRSHQRYVALTDRGGGLVPRFVTFTDGPVRGAPGVVRGNERVLRARLEDAEFYWREDVKRGVDALSDELDRIVFIEGLGSIGQKWRRVLEIAREVNARVPAGLRAGDDALARAARLCKADLASTMIRDGKEFTSLQGVIGAQYARACGEDDGVVEAIRDHYAPRAAADPLPGSGMGRLLGLADRVDTITGCFLAGLKPSGSQDPYALRRSANGVVRLACELPGVRLDDVIELARTSYGSVLAHHDLEERWSKKRAGADLVEFMRGRVEAFLKDQGIAYDVADAVIPVSWTEPGVALSRATEIARLRGDRAFERLVTGVKRVGNILPKERRRVGADWNDVRGGLIDAGGDRRPAFSVERFQDPAENQLLDALRNSLNRIGELESRKAVGEILGVLARLADPIDSYFDRVLVNSDDLAVRENRLAFLAAAYAVFGRYADFQRIVEQGTPGT